MSRPSLNRFLGSKLLVDFVAATGLALSTDCGKLRLDGDGFTIDIVPMRTPNSMVTVKFLQSSRQIALGSVRVGFTDREKLDRSMPAAVVDPNDQVQVDLAHSLRALQVEVLPRIHEVEVRCAGQLEPCPEPSLMPTYVGFGVDADPAVMGVDHPQINGVEDVEGSLLAQADSIDVNDVLMKVGATATDLVSCDFLSSRGLFLSPEMAEKLRSYWVADATWTPITANRNYPHAVRDLVFMEVKERDALDWANSSFRMRRPGHADELCSFVGLDKYQEAVREAQVSADGSSIEPELIRLNDYFDVFRFPLRGELVAQRQVVSLVRAQGWTGASFRTLGYEIN